MASKYHKLAVIGTSYGSLSSLEPFGLAQKHTIKSNSNWKGIILGFDESHLTLINGY